MNQNNRITIKILGNLNDVKETAQKIETLFPVFLEGRINDNREGDGVHLFITLPGSEPKQKLNLGVTF